jgi:hypothetical protein
MADQLKYRLILYQLGPERCNDYVQTELLGQGELGARAKEMRDDRLGHRAGQSLLFKGHFC